MSEITETVTRYRVDDPKIEFLESTNDDGFFAMLKPDEGAKILIEDDIELVCADDSCFFPLYTGHGGYFIHLKDADGKYHRADVTGDLANKNLWVVDRMIMFAYRSAPYLKKRLKVHAIYFSKKEDTDGKT